MVGHSTPHLVFQTHAGHYEPKLSISNPRWVILPSHVGLMIQGLADIQNYDRARSMGGEERAVVRSIGSEEHRQ